MWRETAVCSPLRPPFLLPLCMHSLTHRPIVLHVPSLHHHSSPLFSFNGELTFFTHSHPFLFTIFLTSSFSPHSTSSLLIHTDYSFANSSILSVTPHLLHVSTIHPSLHGLTPLSNSLHIFLFFSVVPP